MNLSPKKQSIAIFFLIIFILFIYTCGINWGLPSFTAWAPDEVTPSIVLKGIEKGFSQGWRYKYPPFHFYLLTVLYSPLLLLHHLKMVDVYSLPTYTILFYIGRFVSVLMGVGTLFFVYRCGLEIYDKKSAFFASLITAFICPYIYYAKLVNLDIPYLFWFTLSLLFYFRMLKHQNLKDYLLFALTATLSMCSKSPAYGFYLLMPLFTFLLYKYLYRNDPEKSAALITALFDRKKILYSFLLAIGLFLIIHNVFFNWKGFLDHLELTTSGGASIRPRYDKSLWGHVQMFWQTLRHFRFSFGWPMYVICLLGLFQAFFKKEKNYWLYFLLIPAISYYLTYITPILYNAVRYLLPCSITLAFLGGKFIADFLNPTHKFFKAKVGLITAVFIYTIAYGFSVNTLMLEDSRYPVENWMQKNIASNEFIFSVGDIKYLPRLDGFKATNVKFPTLKDLAVANPDYIISSSAYDIRRFEPDQAEYEFFKKLDNQELGYQLVLQYHAYPKFNLLDLKELDQRAGDRRAIYSNLGNINPEIKIFKKNEKS